MNQAFQAIIDSPQRTQRRPKEPQSFFDANDFLCEPLCLLSALCGLQFEIIEKQGSQEMKRENLRSSTINQNFWAFILISSFE